MAAKIELLPTLELHLDPENPRLPVDLQGASEGDMLKYLSDETALDELVRSFAENSFFEHEPLIGFNDAKLGLVVLEGNRRLAALKILLGAEEATDQNLVPVVDDVDAAVLESLKNVPVYVVDDREDVHKYLGYRHIGGIKTWSAESKARYIRLEVEKAVAAGSKNAFLDVARRVGSNTQGVRNAYTAISLLRHASDEFGIPVNYVTERRFGVWSRCMTASDVRAYIELADARTHDDVLEAIDNVDGTKLTEVIGDLTAPAGGKPLVNDSRDVTIYGQILRNDVARAALREYRNISVARQIVETEELPERLLSIADRVKIARDEATRAEFSDELSDAADVLLAETRSLQATVKALGDE